MGAECAGEALGVGVARVHRDLDDGAVGETQGEGGPHKAERCAVFDQPAPGHLNKHPPKVSFGDAQKAGELRRAGGLGAAVADQADGFAGELQVFGRRHRGILRVSFDGDWTFPDRAFWAWRAVVTTGRLSGDDRKLDLDPLCLEDGGCIQARLLFFCVGSSLQRLGMDGATPAGIGEAFDPLFAGRRVADAENLNGQILQHVVGFLECVPHLVA